MIASAFFSASETALTSFGELRTLQLLEQGGRGRRILQLWHDVPNRVLTTILIGNNLVNISASAIATELSFRMVGDGVGQANRLALALAVGLMTFLVLVFGEIFPKTYAKHNAEAFLRAGSVLVGCYYLFHPVTSFFVAISKVLAKLSGTRLDSEGPMISMEDIEHMVKVGAKAEALDEDEARYLSGILELGDVVVREIMVPRTDVSGITFDATLDEVLEIVRQCGYSRYPVYEGQIDTVVGVLFVKDLMNVLGSNASQSFDLGALVRQPTFVPETRAIADLLTDFRQKKTHMAIVVDEFGGIAGVATLEDVLEEIVGEIYDEHDAEEPPDLQKTEDGHYLIAGGAAIRDVEAELGVEFPEDGEYDTIAGFVVDSSGDVPDVGFSSSFGGYRFVVLEADERRVALLEAIPEKTDEQESDITPSDSVQEAG